MDKKLKNETETNPNKSEQIRFEHNKQNFKDKVYRSVIVSFFLFLVDKLVFYFKKSMFLNVLTSNEQSEMKFRNSLIYRLFLEFDSKKNFSFSQKLKNNIAEKCENSRIINFCNCVVKSILSEKMKVISAFLFSFGLYSLIIFMLKESVMKDSSVMLLDLIISIFFMTIGVVFFFIKTPFAKLVEGSILFGYLFFSLMGFRKPEGEYSEKTATNKYLLYFAVGMFFGISTFFIPPIYVCLAFVSLAAITMLLYKPETGVFIILLGLPFMPTMVLCGMIILIGVCFFLKFIRGKRSIEFQFLDFFVLLFALAIICSGVFSLAPSGSIKPALVYLCFLCSYFIIVNLIKSLDMIYKSVGCIVLSCLAVSLYGIAQNYLGLSTTTWQDTQMFADISGRVVSTFENPNVLAEYLIMVIPFSLVMFFIHNEPKKKLTAAVIFCVNLMCLIFTWSRGSWLSILISVMVLFVLVNKDFLIVYLGGLFSIPFLPFILPENIVARFASIGDIRDSSTSYRLSIWEASVNMIKDNFIGGIGIGLEPFKKIYLEYSLAGIESAPHSHSLYFQTMIEYGAAGMIIFIILIFLFLQLCITAISKKHSTMCRLFVSAGLCASVAFLMNGITDYVWYNYRVYLMFWVIIAVTTAISRFCIKNTETTQETTL